MPGNTAVASVPTRTSKHSYKTSLRERTLSGQSSEHGGKRSITKDRNESNTTQREERHEPAGLGLLHSDTPSQETAGGGGRYRTRRNGGRGFLQWAPGPPTPDRGPEATLRRHPQGTPQPV